MEKFVGLRVVRGPDWCYGNQDGGEGGVGTIVPHKDSSYQSVDKTSVCVRWDSGLSNMYRAGGLVANDLRVLDNSTVEVRHPGIACGKCDQTEITGFRWQCVDCSTNMCTLCFYNEEHARDHVKFKRYDQPSSEPVDIHIDLNEKKIKLSGVYQGACVKRGADWFYGWEDGDGESVGKVVKAPTDYKMEPGKVWVVWFNEKTEEKPRCYRMGLKGKVDLKVVEEGDVGSWYRPSTLPFLTAKTEMTNLVTVAAAPLSVGDRVKISVDLSTLREMQEDHGGWNPDLEKVIGKVGMIDWIKDAKAHVAFNETCSSRTLECFINTGSLRRLFPGMPVGNVVRIPRSSSWFKKKNSKRNRCITQYHVGRVKQVSLDGDHVDVELCIERGVVQLETVPLSNMEIVPMSQSLTKTLNKLEQLEVHLLFMAIKEGATLAAEEILNKHPSIDINTTINGRRCTPLNYACFTGCEEMVDFLLERKASMEIKDLDDDTPIHSAVMRNHVGILQRLIEAGASLNNFNKKRLTPIQLAAKEGLADCVRLLLAAERCEVNLVHEQDEKTALNHAIIQLKNAVNPTIETVRLLVHSGKCNITLHDKKGFTSLHYAALCGVPGVMKVLRNHSDWNTLAYEGASQSGGDTPLHLACQEGHYFAAKLLVDHANDRKLTKEEGIDKPTLKGETALMRAISKGHLELIELLVKAGANLTVTDLEGDTPFVYAYRFFNKLKNEKEFTRKLPSEELAPGIHKCFMELRKKRPINVSWGASILNYLCERGGRPASLRYHDMTLSVDDEHISKEINEKYPEPYPETNLLDDDSPDLNLSSINGINQTNHGKGVGCSGSFGISNQSNSLNFQAQKHSSHELFDNLPSTLDNSPSVSQHTARSIEVSKDIGRQQQAADSTSIERGEEEMEVDEPSAENIVSSVTTTDKTVVHSSGRVLVTHQGKKTTFQTAPTTITEVLPLGAPPPSVQCSFDVPSVSDVPPEQQLKDQDVFTWRMEVKKYFRTKSEEEDDKKGLSKYIIEYKNGKVENRYSEKKNYFLCTANAEGKNSKCNGDNFEKRV